MNKKFINNDLKKYIEENLFPEYQKNDLGHNIEHIKYVINRSFKFADTIPNINYDIVYTVASYHDIGHYINPKKHEIISGEIMFNDKNLKKFFSDEELILIKEAIEDHRASADHEPRSIYGKIVSTADRNTTVESCLKSTYTYEKKLYPEESDAQLFDRAFYYLNIKFGDNGYAKFFFKDEEYEQFLKDIRKLLSDKNNYIETQRNYINKLKKSGEKLD